MESCEPQPSPLDLTSSPSQFILGAHPTGRWELNSGTIFNPKKQIIPNCPSFGLETSVHILESACSACHYLVSQHWLKAANAGTPDQSIGGKKTWFPQWSGLNKAIDGAVSGKKGTRKTTGLSCFSLFKWPYIKVIAHFQTHPNIISSHMKNHHVFVAEISHEATIMFRRVKSPQKSRLCRVLNPMKSQVLSSQSPWNHHFPNGEIGEIPQKITVFLFTSPEKTQLDCCCLGCQAEEQKKHRRASLDKASHQEVTPDEWWP